MTLDVADQDLPEVSILIVSYNTAQLTLDCLNSVYAHPPAGEFEVIVVDNNSHDGSPAAVAENFPQVQLFALQENLGFARGNNVAMQHATKPILVLLNSDTLVHSEAFTHLQRAFRDNHEMAAAGGRLLNADGSVQYGLRYFPRIRNALSEGLFLHHLFSGPSWGELENRRDHYQQSHRAEWVSGAYLAVRSEVYKQIGGLDAGFFMYSEDTDWCYRIQEKCGQVWYLADSIVTHLGGGSSRANPRLLVIRTASKDRYARLHMSPVLAAVYRICLVLGLLVRIALALLPAVFRPRFRSEVRWRLQTIKELYCNPLSTETCYE